MPTSAMRLTLTAPLAKCAAVATFGLLACIPLAAPAAALTRTTAYDYDATSGLLTKEIIEPDDSTLCVVSSYSYDSYGNKTGSTTRNCNGSTGSVAGLNSEAAAPTGDAVFSARTTRTTYDARGQFPVTSANALAHTETRSWQAGFGVPTAQTGPNGLTISWTYDAFGRKRSEIRADGNRTQWDYLYCSGYHGGTASCPVVGGAAAVVVVVSTPLAADNVTQNGPVSKTYYDALERPLRSETQGFDGTGVSTAIYQDTQYDRLGRPAQKSRPYYAGQTAYWTTTTYDALGRVVRLAEPDGATTLTAYQGLSITVTDPKGQTRSTRKNSQGQTIGVTDMAGSMLSLHYDPFGNLTRTVDPAGNDVVNTYDVRGRKSAMFDPDMGAWTYAYDALGQLIRQVDAKGQRTLMEYDLQGRMTRRSEADLISTWTYDRYKNGAVCPQGIGKLCETDTDAGYQRKHAYDNLGRPSRTDSTIDTQHTVTQTYDSAGRVSSQTYPGGVTLRYTYTPLGYLREVQNSLCRRFCWQATQLDAEGHLLQQTAGSGVLTFSRFDPNNGRLNSSMAWFTRANSLNYQYDPVGNVTMRQDTALGVTESFGYDNANRLTGVTINSPSGISTQITTYDALGNITSRSDVGSYEYPQSGPGSVRPHAVSRVKLINGNTRVYTYDANGNLSAETELDAANNVIPDKGRIELVTSFNMPLSFAGAGASAAFVYGPEHQRVKQISSVHGTTIYLHPGNSGELGYEKDIRPDNSVEQRVFITAYGQAVAVIKQVTANGSTTSSVRYLHRDHLGSTTAVSDESGRLIERLSYDVYGKRRFISGEADVNNTIVPINTERGFTNHEHLDEIGVIHMNARVYEPRIGRFVSPDPYIQDPTNLQSYNRYAYCFNNPVSCTDPSGYFSLRKLLKFVAVVAVAAFAPEFIGNAFMTSAANAAVASTTLSATTAFASAGIAMEAGTLTALGSFAASAGASFAATMIATDGNVGASLRAGVSGGVLGATNAAFGETWNAQRVAANAVAGGVGARIQGGSFKDGLVSSGVSATARFVYNDVVPFEADWGPGEGAVSKGPYDMPKRFRNNIGEATQNVKSQSMLGEGGIVSRTLNHVPGINAVAGLHDVFQVRLQQAGGESARDLFNIPGMLPAALITYTGLANDLSPINNSLTIKKAN